MLIRAIKTNQTDFLYCVWAYNKNYERLPRNNLDSESEDTDSDLEN